MAAHNNLGAAFVSQKRFDEAIDEYQKVLAIKPEDVTACNNLGEALYAQGAWPRPSAITRRPWSWRLARVTSPWSTPFVRESSFAAPAPRRLPAAPSQGRTLNRSAPKRLAPAKADENMGREPRKSRPPDHRARGSRAKPGPDAADRRGARHERPPEERTPSAAEPPTRHNYPVLAVCGFLLLAVVLVFSQTVGFEFVNFDDFDYVYENPNVARGLSPAGIVWALTGTHSDNWHPLTSLSYLLDYECYGLAPWGYHLTNVLLHGAATIGLFLVLWRMTGDLWPSAFVAAVFAIHPLRAESVAWISERKDVLSGLFFVLTLGAYVGYAPSPLFVGSLPGGRGALCPGPDGQTHAGDAAVRAAIVGLLAAATVGQGAVAAAVRKTAAVRAIGRVLCGDASGPERGHPADGKALSGRPDGQRRRLLRGVRRPVLLPCRAGGVLPASWQQPAGLADRRRPVAVGLRMPRLSGFEKDMALPADRLALVLGHARAGDRSGAGGPAGDGRSIYLSAADWLGHGTGLGRETHVRKLAPPRVALRRRLRTRVGSLDGMRVAANDLLGRQRDAVEPR